MRRYLFVYLSIIISVFLFNTRAKADLIITNADERVMVGTQLWVLQSKNELTFNDVLRSAEFKKYDQDVPNLGISATSTWLRFTLDNQSKSADLLLEVAYAILDEVEFFVPDSLGRYNPVLMGEVKNFDSRKYKHPNYIFDLNILPGQSKTYYLRIKSIEQLILPISVNKATTLWSYLRTENLLSGIFLGVVLIMFIYNLFLFFSVRDKSYIYYVVYVGSVGFTQIGIKGFTFQYLWPDATAFEQKSVIIFACISGIAALCFSKNFLVTRQMVPKFDKVLTAIICLLSIALALTLVGYTQIGFQLMQISTTCFAVAILIVSGMIMRKGYVPAQFVFYSWSVLLCGAIIFALKDYGILPYNTFTSYSMQAASAIEMALLSFALANKINTYRKEKEQSQAEALSVSIENERLITEQNVVLEKRVEERTHELKESNENLQNVLTSLKEAQSQLVESEKMASLGQLTAGVAHEINNPINFVTSNVAPLKRDLGMMLETLAEIEKIAVSDLTAAEKVEQINAFKAGMDFDYLKTEISHLLNGMYEGATRTSEIVKSLRIFSRVDEDDLKMADINECMDSTLIIVNTLLNDKRVSLHKDFGDLPLTECYPGKLNQVFLNIISNAVYAIYKRHGESGNGVLYISTALQGTNVLITIKDNGTGMDLKTKEKIFEPFFTTKDVGEGTGLGMSIVYNTIKKHNGEISLVTALNEGSQFILKIPLLQKAGNI